MASLGLRCANLGYQGGQIDQVSYSKERSPGRNDKEEIFGLCARPPCRQRRHITAVIAVEKQVVTPLNPPLNKVECLPE